MRRLGPAVVLGVGAGAYALTVGTDTITFDATPLIVGLVVLAAGAVGRQARLVSISLPLLGWGAAVLLVRHGPVPDRREAPAFMIGVGVGLLVASWWCRRTAIPITGAVVTVILGGLSFYFAYDYDVIEGWGWWAVALLAWAGFEALRSMRARD